MLRHPFVIVKLSVGRTTATRILPLPMRKIYISLQEQEAIKFSARRGGFLAVWAAYSIFLKLCAAKATGESPDSSALSLSDWLQSKLQRQPRDFQYSVAAGAWAGVLAVISGAAQKFLLSLGMISSPSAFPPFGTWSIAVGLSAGVFVGVVQGILRYQFFELLNSSFKEALTLANAEREPVPEVCNVAPLPPNVAEAISKRLRAPYGSGDDSLN